MTKLILKDEVYAIIGAAMEVHKEKGCGFAEAVYQECMEIELTQRRIENLPLHEMPIHYKGRRLKKSYIADFLACGKIIVELKALDELTPREESQVINYLKTSGLQVAVLINFGARSLEWKRIVLSGTEPDQVNLHATGKRRVSI